MQPLQTLTIIGGVSRAAALVNIFSESGITVNWHLRSPDHVDFLLANSRNPNDLGFLQRNNKYVRPTRSLEDAIAFADDIVFAVLSADLESTISGFDENLPGNKQLYVSIKGMVSDQFMLPSVFIAQKFDAYVKDLTVLAGPCHAEEIAVDKKHFYLLPEKILEW